MKNALFLFSFLLLVVQNTLVAQPQRIILDTDANNELDDQHAIAYLLFNKDAFIVEGITTNRTYSGGGIANHTAEAERVVKMCNSWGQFPILSGADGNYTSIKPYLSNVKFDGSDAVNFIIEKAHETASGEKLLLVPIGKITNIALALEKDSTIIPKVKVIFLGTQIPSDKGEYNQDNDRGALNSVLEKDVEFWIVPADVSCKALTISKAKIFNNMPGKGPNISPPVEGRHGGFYNNFGDYSVNLFSNVFNDSRCIFDVVALLTAKNPDLGQQQTVYDPHLNDDGSWSFNGGVRKVIYFDKYNSRAVHDDFWKTMNSTGNK